MIWLILRASSATRFVIVLHKSIRSVHAQRAYLLVFEPDRDHFRIVSRQHWKLLVRRSLGHRQNSMRTLRDPMMWVELHSFDEIDSWSAVKQSQSTECEWIMDTSVVKSLCDCFHFISRTIRFVLEAGSDVEERRTRNGKNSLFK